MQDSSSLLLLRFLAYPAPRSALPKMAAPRPRGRPSPSSPLRAALTASGSRRGR
nr:MAG TPA: hypothetical protein [Caudoviricetes sp.]